MEIMDWVLTAILVAAVWRLNSVEQKLAGVRATLAIKEETLTEVWSLYRDARDAERSARDRLADVAARALGPMQGEEIPDPPTTRDADRALWSRMREEELRAEGRIAKRAQETEGAVHVMAPDPQGP